MIPDDLSYWAKLSRAITQVLRASKDASIRFLSIDDITADVPVRVEAGKTVWLVAWMLGDANQEKYKLAIKLDRPMDEMRQADWDELLKAPLNSAALKVDKLGRTITLLPPLIS